MLGLKINHLVDLQDARYCASFGADYLVFTLERGHNQKLPEHTVAEQLEWLAGPRMVLNFGMDIDNAHNYLRDFSTSAATLFQFHSQSDWASLELPPGRCVLNLPFRSGGELAEGFQAMGEQAAAVHLVELQPLEAGRSLVEAINAALLERGNLCLNADAPGLDVLESLELRPECVALRRLIQENLTHLDYDKLEAVLASPWFDKELI